MGKGAQVLSQPLQLQKHVTLKADMSFELLPLFDILVIVVFFGLFSSPFVLPQGMSMDLINFDKNLLSGSEVSAVLTVKSKDMLLFDGENLRLEDFEDKAMQYTRNNPSSVLLVRLDPGVDLESFFDICGAARSAGFVRVHVAGEQKQLASEAF